MLTSFKKQINMLGMFRYKIFIVILICLFFGYEIFIFSGYFFDIGIRKEFPRVGSSLELPNNWFWDNGDEEYRHFARATLITRESTLQPRSRIQLFMEYAGDNASLPLNDNEIRNLLEKIVINTHYISSYETVESITIMENGQTKIGKIVVHPSYMSSLSGIQKLYRGETIAIYVIAYNDKQFWQGDPMVIAVFADQSNSERLNQQIDEMIKSIKFLDGL